MEIMSAEEKGYKCPDLSCAECPYMKTLCIVYSVAGRKKYKEWKRRQSEIERRSGEGDNLAGS